MAEILEAAAVVRRMSREWSTPALAAAEGLMSLQSRQRFLYSPPPPGSHVTPRGRRRRCLRAFLRLGNNSFAVRNKQTSNNLLLLLLQLQAEAVPPAIQLGGGGDKKVADGLSRPEQTELLSGPLLLLPRSDLRCPREGKTS